MQLLKQNTVFVFRIGPFLDDTDGKTAETGLSIGQADIQISKAGGAFAQTSASSPTTTHDINGWYQCPLTTTDTNTLGLLDIQIVMSGALPVWRHFMVVPAEVYDTLVSGSDRLTVDIYAGQLAIKKNTALANFPFLMVDSSNQPKTGLTITATRKIDSGSFAACANSASEIGNGWYEINLDATDLNGTTIALRFTATGAADRNITIITQA